MTHVACRARASPHVARARMRMQVPIGAMDVVLTSMSVGVPLDALAEAFHGFDCESSRFGQLLSRRLGYMQIVADAWRGAEGSGMERRVRSLVKCPPKPMLPDTTRVHIRHRLQVCARVRASCARASRACASRACACIARTLSRVRPCLRTPATGCSGRRRRAG